MPQDLQHACGEDRGVFGVVRRDDLWIQAKRGVARAIPRFFYSIQWRGWFARSFVNRVRV